VADLRERLIVALDVPGGEPARDLVGRLGAEVLWYKVGSQLFVAEGPGFVRWLLGQGKRVFLDLKLHDIPNTVEGALRATAALGVQMTTVHAAAGPGALERAAAVERETGLMVVGVTVLTSREAPSAVSLQEEVVARAEDCRRSGLRAVVAPAPALPALREALGETLRIVTPGIRPAGRPRGDQVWIATPAEALRLGASWLVVGRPVLEAEDPAGAVRAILEEMEAASR
jgi:orotidine-5'-phosphate decarboxylase